MENLDESRRWKPTETCLSKAENEQGHVCQEGPFPLGLCLGGMVGDQTVELGLCQGCFFSSETLTPSATTDRNETAQAWRICSSEFQILLGK